MRPHDEQPDDDTRVDDTDEGAAWADASDPRGADADTWVERAEVPSRGAVIKSNQQAHHNKMQARLLGGLGTMFMLTLAAVILGPAFRWITEDFARQLAQMILPALLASGGTMFGFFFKSN